MAIGERARLITPVQMLWGYANGIFPMAVSASDPALHWFDPPERGVLPVGKSMFRARCGGICGVATGRPR